MKQVRHAACVLLLLGLNACSGDARPLLEAVEVEQLNLASVQVVPPVGSLPELFINTGEQITFSVNGVDAAGAAVALTGNDRRWRVSDSRIASISSNGVLTARSEGAVNIDLLVGELQSNQVTVTVSNASLTAIDSILGESSVDRCVPANYTATGQFSDQSKRLLSVVEWTLDNSDNGTLTALSNGGVSLNGLNASVVQLSANAAGQSFSTPVTVSDNLLNIVIRPNPASVDVDKTLDLSASGRYGAADDATTNRDITDTVNWTLASGGDAANISNAGSNRGQVTGVAAGQATVVASCGVDQGSVVLVVNGSSSSDDDDEAVSFSVASPLVLPAGGSSRQLRVSKGSDYSSASSDDLTSSATWRLLQNSGAVQLVTEGANKGQVTPVRQGTDTIQVVSGSRVAELVVNVTQSGIN